MWADVGVVRTRMGMAKAVKELTEMASKFEPPMTRRAHEASNLHLAALLVARSALGREESRGAHYRMDYPDHDDKKFLKHSMVRGDKIVIRRLTAIIILQFTWPLQGKPSTPKSTQ